uniref:MFS transporter, SIT family, siderophore-iron:H+ symporter n=1 Tax=Fusarium oxysporum (strain Fo5176) TaxID=660025 RepID=A0A0D2XU73_FUSOF
MCLAVWNLSAFLCSFILLETVIEAAAQNLDTYSAGAVIYQIGYTMILLLVEVIIGDITSVRSRLFFSYIPALPFIINTGVSGDVTEAVLGATTWRWGIGMWCIIYPVCALPLIISLLVVGHRAKKAGHLVGYRSSFQQLGFNKLTVELFWLLDIIGVILLIAVFALLLVPLTIAGGFESKWSDPQVVAPLVIGFVCIPVFVVWELRAPHPLVPFHHMKDRSVWAPMGIACMLNFAWTMQGDYLYTVLQVSFNFSIKAATRVQSLYSFASVITGTILGLIVYKVRRFKVFIVSGTMPFPRRIRSSHPIPRRPQLRQQVGSAFGNAVSGAIWTQVLPVRLAQSFSSPETRLSQCTPTLNLCLPFSTSLLVLTSVMP